MREAGDVCFADVYKDGTGACEYVRYEDMKYALKKLDDTKFKSHEVSFQKCFFKMEYQYMKLSVTYIFRSLIKTIHILGGDFICPS